MALVALTLCNLLSLLPGWTIAGAVTSGTVEAKTAGVEETISGDGPEEAAAAATNGAATSGDGLEEAPTTTGVAGNRKFLLVTSVHPYLFVTKQLDELTYLCVMILIILLRLLLSRSMNQWNHDGWHHDGWQDDGWNDDGFKKNSGWGWKGDDDNNRRTCDLSDCCLARCEGTNFILYRRFQRTSNGNDLCRLSRADGGTGAREKCNVRGFCYATDEGCQPSDCRC